jgi:hypothetical protein
MAVMLRSYGVASRVVNGFLPGEYNEAAGAYTVRQSDAHSWVEVYFPESRAWVTFDPTPAAGRTEPVRTGLTAQLGKYAEALELMWFQYVVGYDRQEQRTLATSLHNRLFDFGRWLSQTVAWIKEMLPANQWAAAAIGLSILALIVLIFIMARRIRVLGWRKALRLQVKRSAAEASAVVFYERFSALLAQRGFQRDAAITPLEFAGQIGTHEAFGITRAYNRVRFGKEKLSSAEMREINQLLLKLEQAQR